MKGLAARALAVPLLLLAGAHAVGAEVVADVVPDVAVDVGKAEPFVLVRADDATPMHIDGALDEGIWKELPIYGDFRVLEPDTLQKPPHATRVKIFYTSRGIYVGVDMDEPKDKLLRRISGRDGSFQLLRDEFSMTLDTSGAARYGYWFNVALGDSQSDGTLLPERQYSNTWDGPWRGATRITDHGWSAELFIPWGTVSMPATGEHRRFGLYMSRRVGYRDERWGFPALPPTQSRFMSALQPLELSDVAPRQQYNVYPFVATARDTIDDKMITKVGSDLFWRPTTNSQVLATINPDFNVVEVDDLVVNLTATETFYPEKRLFFLEGQEIFVATPRADPRSRNEVGQGGPPYTMVNTRRIGGAPRLPTLAADTTIDDRDTIEPIDLLGAAKATGQFGQFRYGLLTAFEDDVALHATRDGQRFIIDEPGDDYGIARVLYEGDTNGAYHALGFLSTAVVNPDRDALANGIDGHFISASTKLKIDGQTFTSHIDDVDTGYGGYVDAEYNFRQGVSQRFGIEYLDRHVDLNDLGYLPRNDQWRVRTSHQRTVSDFGWAKENQFDVRGFLSENHENLFIGGGIFFADRLTLNDLSRVTARIGWLPKSFDDFNSEGNGTFRVDEKVQSDFAWESNAARIVSVEIAGGYDEEDLGGDAWHADASLAWRPTDNFNTTIGTMYEKHRGWLLHQSGTSMATYDADVWQPKVTAEFYISAKQQFRASLQWAGIKAKADDDFIVPAKPGELIGTGADDGSGDFSVSNLSLQLRYRWEIAPLSEIFVVWTVLADQTRALGDSTYQNLFSDAFNDPLEDLLVFKVRYRIGS